MQQFGFQNLKVWNKAHSLVLGIYNITRKFPNDERYCLISQIRRSSVSICANIAEGSRKTKKDFARYLDIANGSLEETKYHLILSKDLGYCSYSEFENLYFISEEVGRMLYNLSRKINSST